MPAHADCLVYLHAALSSRRPPCPSCKLALPIRFVCGRCVCVRCSRWSCFYMQTLQVVGVQTKEKPSVAAHGSWPLIDAGGTRLLYACTSTCASGLEPPPEEVRRRGRGDRPAPPYGGKSRGPMLYLGCELRQVGYATPGQRKSNRRIKKGDMLPGWTRE